MDTEVRRATGNRSDGAWSGLDHERAVRESGKRYRPASQYDRPRESERNTDGNPCGSAHKAAADGEAKMKALLRLYRWRVQGGVRKCARPAQTRDRQTSRASPIHNRGENGGINGGKV